MKSGCKFDSPLSGPFNSSMACCLLLAPSFAVWFKVSLVQLLTMRSSFTYISGLKFMIVTPFVDFHSLYLVHFFLSFLPSLFLSVLKSVSQLIILPFFHIFFFFSFFLSFFLSFLSSFLFLFILSFLLFV